MVQLYGQLVEHLVYSVRDPWWHERQMERSHSNRGEHQQSHQSSPRHAIADARASAQNRPARRGSMGFHAAKVKKKSP